MAAEKASGAANKPQTDMPKKGADKAEERPDKKRAVNADSNAGTPAFPYTTEPQALKRLLTEIPKRPKPPKMNLETLKGWNVSSSNNASTVIRVMKQVGLLQDSGQPTDQYAALCFQVLVLPH